MLAQLRARANLGQRRLSIKAAEGDFLGGTKPDIAQRGATLLGQRGGNRNQTDAARAEVPM